MLCLGIETSCDETAASVLRYESPGRSEILSEEISSQTEIHKAYGGIVPELAAREHLRNLPLITELALKKAGCGLKDLELISVTKGPGLKGCLLAGVNFARGLSLPHNVNLLGVNHIEAHMFSCFLTKPLQFPFLSLVVSGGHTEIALVSELGRYKLLARTLDDAAGEAFDKAANLLGLPYPGGARLSAMAAKVKKSRFELPKVMREAQGFSFSGLKTAILLLVKKFQDELSKDREMACEMAFAIQKAIVDAIYFKVEQAVAESGVKRVAVSGGVSANTTLRDAVSSIPGVEAFYPKKEHCTDNASMIAFLGLLRASKFGLGGDLDVLARWPVEAV